MTADSPVPRQLGPYEVVRRIGAGGMAEVYLARRFGASGWEKTVALKLLRPEHRGRAEFERLLISEARLGARFAHPGLVCVHDLGLAEASPGGPGSGRGEPNKTIYYVCMDYVDGCDLAALVARRALPRALALAIAEQLAAALAYVHTLTDTAGRPLGLVHRDVSPANVLVSRTGEVKLSDFGIAKSTTTGDETWGRLRKGKYAYMAPEQINGEPLTGAADVFALAVTLHECLLGRRPFDGDNPREVMEAIRQARLDPTHDFGALPHELVALLRRALAKEPAQRGDAAEFARSLAAARRREPAVAAFDLAAWVSDALDERKPVVDVGLDTLGMDE